MKSVEELILSMCDDGCWHMIMISYGPNVSRKIYIDGIEVIEADGENKNAGYQGIK